MLHVLKGYKSWPNVNSQLCYLTSFELIARLGRFRMTANKLRITRWTVSDREKLLETRLDGQLIECHLFLPISGGPFDT